MVLGFLVHSIIDLSKYKTIKDTKIIKVKPKVYICPGISKQKQWASICLSLLMCVQPNWNIHPCSFLKSYQPNLLTIKETRGENQKKVTFSMHNKIAKPSLSFETLFYISNRINKIN